MVKDVKNMTGLDVPHVAGHLAAVRCQGLDKTKKLIKPNLDWQGPQSGLFL